jgi:hypothetical protein
VPGRFIAKLSSTWLGLIDDIGRRAQHKYIYTLQWHYGPVVHIAPYKPSLASAATAHNIYISACVTIKLPKAMQTSGRAMQATVTPTATAAQRGTATTAMATMTSLKRTTVAKACPDSALSVTAARSVSATKPNTGPA